MEQLVNFVIRPPRAEYDPARDLLQPEFPLRGRRYQREDLQITNSQGHLIQCSHYMPFSMTEEKPLPCVIYCHGNSGCRADASEAAVILLPSNITVFSLDFSGSGLSEGEYVTLGWNEKDDLKAVVAHLRTDKRVSCIGLWGRSMGAVTCLLYGTEDPSIAGMVLDSPFSNLVDLMMELVDVYKVRLPKFTLKVAIQYMRKVIQKKARFDILELDAVQVAKKSFIPALFGHATEDSFIQPHHSDRIYKAYMGDKNIIKFEGDHNTPRPRFYYDSINIFFHNVLQPPEGPVADLASGTPYFDMDELEPGGEENVWYQVLRAMQPSFLPPDVESFRSDLSDVNDGNSGWHMSRTEVPSNLDDFQEDLSKLLAKDDIDVAVSEGSSSSTLQMHENGDESSAPVPYGETVNDNWNSYFPEGSTAFSEATLQSRFAQFPSTVEDEERMIMEALALSLQETHITSSQASETHDNALGVQATSSQSPVTNLQGDLPTMSSGGDLAQRKREEQLPTSESQTVGTLEALGQRWGLGLFRAMSSRQSDNSRS
eukprot:c25019_g1_i2 orf=745-2370(-)